MGLGEDVSGDLSINSLRMGSSGASGSGERTSHMQLLADQRLVNAVRNQNNESDGGNGEAAAGKSGSR